MHWTFRMLFVTALWLTFTGSNPSHAQADAPIQPLAAGVTITDVTVSEGGTASFIVTLTGIEFSTLYTFDYAVLPVSATGGLDYTPASGSFAYFDIVPPTPPVITTTISVDTIQDLLDENAETFIVQLSNPSPTVFFTDGIGVGTITDNDLPPLLSISNGFVTEGDTGFALLTFTVSLNTPSGREVSVTWATANGTAVAPTDYQAQAPTVITLAPGQTERTVGVRVFGDLTIEPHETLFVNLSAPVNASFTDSQGQGAILNNDEVGGAGFLLTSLTAVINVGWDAGNQQTGYTLLKYNTTTATTELIAIGASAVTYTDSAVANGIIYCYILAPTGPGGVLGFSDLLCGMVGVESGSINMTAPTVRLSGPAQATITWVTPAGGVDSYLLQRIPLDGSPVVPVALPGFTTGSSQPLVAAGACFQLIGYKGAAFGVGNVVCAVPGVGTLELAATDLGDLLPTSLQEARWHLVNREG